MLGNVGTHAVGQTLSNNPPYNVATDFPPVVLVADLSLVLMARKDLPANNLQEFIAYAKANQDKMQFASAGAGSATHLGCVMLNAAIGIDVTHVPYRGGEPAMQDLIAGRSTTSASIPDETADRKRRHQADRDTNPGRGREFAELASAHEQGLPISRRRIGRRSISRTARPRRSWKGCICAGGSEDEPMFVKKLEGERHRSRR